MKKLIVVALLALTFSFTACGSEKSVSTENTKTEVSKADEKTEKKTEKKEDNTKVATGSKVGDAENTQEVTDSTQDTEASEGTETADSVKSNSSNSNSGNSGSTSNGGSNNSGNSGSTSNGGSNNSGNSGSTSNGGSTNNGNSNTGNSNSGNATTPTPAPAPAPAPAPTPAPSSSDDALPDDDVSDLIPQEQPTETTFEDVLAQYGVTNYVLTGPTSFIDYDGYQILIDGVWHNIWKGTDYGTSWPYGIWGGGCGSVSGVPTGWSASWGYEQTINAWFAE